MNRSSLNVLGCYILWGLLPIFWKLLAGVNSAYVLAQRIVFSCVFCLAVILIRKNGGEIGKIIKNKSERRKFFLCGILISVNWGVYILTVAMGRILEASLAYFMNPLFSVLIGAIFFKERLSRVQWTSVALAFAGVMFSVIRYGEVPYLAIIIGLSFALYGALKKGIKADSETSICMETMAVLPIALVFIAYAQFSGFTTFSSLMPLAGTPVGMMAWWSVTLLLSNTFLLFFSGLPLIRSIRGKYCLKPLSICGHLGYTSSGRKVVSTRG